MPTERPTAQILIGPRSLDDRICRLMYIRETEEVWAEVWKNRSWQRAHLLARHLLKAPPAAPGVLARFGVPGEMGELDREQACA